MVAALAILNVALGVSVLWMALDRDFSVAFHAWVKTRFPRGDPFAFVYAGLLTASQLVSVVLAVIAITQRKHIGATAIAFAALAAVMGFGYLGALAALPAQFSHHDSGSIIYGGVTVGFAILQCALGAITARGAARTEGASPRGRWFAAAAAITANAILIGAVLLFVGKEPYEAFVRMFALIFSVPCAIVSILAGLAAWRAPGRGVFVFGLAFHAALMPLLILWTLVWGFAGLWAQSPSLLGALLLASAGEAIVIIAQFVAYIVLLANFRARRDPSTPQPDDPPLREEGVVRRSR